MHFPPEIWRAVMARMALDGHPAEIVVGAVCRSAAEGSPSALDGRHVRDAAVHAAGLGNVDVLRWLMEERRARGSRLRTACSVAAAIGGHLPVLELLWGGEACPQSDQVYVRAAAYGKLEVLRWAAGRGYAFFTENCATAAAQGGHLATLRWLLEEADCPTDRMTVKSAAGSEELFLMVGSPDVHEHLLRDAPPVAPETRIELLEWLLERPATPGSPGSPGSQTLLGPDLCAAAAGGGNWEVLRWLRDRGCPWDEWTCTMAVDAGRLDIMQWARENGCPWDERTSKFAAYRGRLDVLRWALENGCPWNGQLLWFWYPGAFHPGILRYLHARGVLALRPEVMREPAASNDLETLKWLRGEGCPCDHWAYGGAAARGHTSVLRWLREQGGLRTALSLETAASKAAQGGHIETLEWLHSLGCGKGTDACYLAAKHGELEALRWLRERDWPWCPEVCIGPAENGHLELLQWALRNGAPWDSSAADWAAFNGRLPVLRWLRSAGYTMTGKSLLERAAAGGQVEVLAWARQEMGDVPWCSTYTMAASECGHFEALRWLVGQGCPCHRESCIMVAAERRKRGHLALERWLLQN